MGPDPLTPLDSYYPKLPAPVFLPNTMMLYRNTNRERLNQRNYIIAATSTTMLVAICFALALCLQNHVSEHRRLAPKKGKRVSIIPGDNVPIYGRDGKPYKGTNGRNSAPDYQKDIAAAKGKAPYERVWGVVKDIRTINGVVYYGLDAFNTCWKYFTDEYLTKYVPPPPPTKEEILEEKIMKQAREAIFKSVQRPNWLNKGCTYHVKSCETESSEYSDARPVKEGDYKANLVYQSQREDPDGKWLVALDWNPIDPENIDPQKCVGAKCGNCRKNA